ncbi:hypothetical protein SKAU_G00339060 [Synaphobranchus kaupii]|uniref:Uncharacterized protein n=1 Tax=Synaphobranchus kaupii TaxID=118154 RepID=A0A9Q1EMK5_SYNKA|nr:hypothetical protein SKAU_G00339060 [Synaphobranchus kaupii]
MAAVLVPGREAGRGNAESGRGRNPTGCQGNAMREAMKRDGEGGRPIETLPSRGPNVGGTGTDASTPRREVALVGTAQWEGPGSGLEQKGSWRGRAAGREREAGPGALHAPLKSLRWGVSSGGGRRCGPASGQTGSHHAGPSSSSPGPRPRLAQTDQPEPRSAASLPAALSWSSPWLEMVCQRKKILNRP